jgi:hypothetical protein
MSRQWITAAVATLLITGCAAEHRDWAFVQSIGGMAVGTPYRTASGVMLPVAVDVSGLKTITTKPRVMNSGLAVKEIVVRREGHTLGIALFTTAAGGSSARTTSGDVALGDLQPGRYSVVYAEPNGGRVDMGEVTVAP